MTATIVDEFDNQQDGVAACDEAMYVDTLNVGSGATLDTEGCKLYYRHLILAIDGSIPDRGMWVLNIADGDWDGEGDVDLSDWDAFFARLMVAAPSHVSLDRFDADYAGDLDLADIAGFQVRFTAPQV